MFSIKTMNKIICLSLGLTCVSVFAGSPGGLWLVVMPLDNAVVYKQTINDFLNKNMGVDKYISCDHSRVSADVFYITRHPVEITTKLIKQALSNNSALELLKKHLREYRDDLVTSDDGFNGLLGYDVVEENMIFYGIQSKHGKMRNEIYKSTLSFSDLGNEQRLSNAICMALRKIPVSAP